MKEFSKEKAQMEHVKRQEKFTNDNVNDILDKSEELKPKFQKQSKLSKYFEDFKLLFSMIKDYYKKDYTDVPWYIISSIGAALLYVLSPIDLIPDFIPFFGYLDDAAVFAFCLSQVSLEVDKYKIWKIQNG